MEALQDNPQGTRVYRFSIFAVATYLLGGAVSVVFGLIFLTQMPKGPASSPLIQWVVGGYAILLALYSAVAAAYSVVIFDPEYITVRGPLQTRSIRRASVKGYKDDWYRRQRCLRLISDSSAESDLLVPNHYAFDDEWRNWISVLPNLGAVDESRFTLKD